MLNTTPTVREFDNRNHADMERLWLARIDALLIENRILTQSVIEAGRENLKLHDEVARLKEQLMRRYK